MAEVSRAVAADLLQAGFAPAVQEPEVPARVRTAAADLRERALPRVLRESIQPAWWTMAHPAAES